MKQKKLNNLYAKKFSTEFSAWHIEFLNFYKQNKHFKMFKNKTTIEGD